MKIKNLNQISSWIIIFQMAFGPTISMANTGAGIANAVNMGSGILQGVMQSMQQQAQQTMAMQQQEQELKWMDPTDCGSSGRCTDDYFPECPILKTEPNFVQTSLCTSGIDPGDPQAQMKFSQLQMYAQFYNGMHDAYKNYSVQGNKRAQYGIDCVAKRVDQVAELLKKRELEIDNLISKIEKQQEVFKRQSQKDIDAITEAQALLRGGQNESFKRALANKKTNMFQATFNDPACNSVIGSLGAEDFNQLGSAKGLRGIQENLNTMSRKAEPGGYSAIDFDKSLRQNMEQDIMKLADEAAKDFEVDDPRELAPESATNLVSTYNINQNPNFKAALADTRNEIRREFKKAETEAEQAIADLNPKLKESLFNVNGDFEATLRNFEIQEDAACWSRSPIVGMFLNDPAALWDPTLSKEANRDGDSEYKTRIRTILADPIKPLEQKLSEIQQAEANNKGKIQVRLRTSIVAEETQFLPKDNNSISSMVNAVVQNCKAQFDNNPTTSGLSKRQVMGKSRQIRNKLMNTRSTMKSKIKNDVIKRMISCADNQQANAKASNSCGPKSLSVQSDPQFCLNKAFACAENMRSCTKKAQDKVGHVENLSEKHFDRYRKNVEKNKFDLMKMYAMTEQISQMDAGMLGMRFNRSMMSLPKGLSFDFKTQDKTFLQDLDVPGVEDIDQYTNQMKANLENLKAEIVKQNNWILNGGNDAGGAGTKYNGLIGHLENLKNNHKTAQEKVSQKASECVGAMTAFTEGLKAMNAAQAKAAADQAAEVGKVCSKFNAIKSSPNPSCDKVAEVADEMANIAVFNNPGDSAAIGQLNAFANTCEQYHSDANTDAVTTEDVDNILAANNIIEADALKGYCEKNPSKSKCKTLIEHYDCQDRAKTTCDEKKIANKNSTPPIPAFSYTGCIADEKASYLCEDKNESNLRVAIEKFIINQETKLVENYYKQKEKDYQKALKKAGANNLGEVYVASCLNPQNGQPDPGKGIMDFFQEQRNRGIAPTGANTDP